MQVMQIAHGGVSLLMIGAMLGHIYIGSVGMEGALDAMNSGQVDRNWAAAHHDLWLAELEATSTPPGHPAE
jgi:formate dehydrogenase subunit gamma